MWVWFLAGVLCFFSINSYADNTTSSTQLSEVDVIWIFQPGRIGDLPVESNVTVPIRFRLEQ